MQCRASLPAGRFFSGPGSGSKKGRRDAVARSEIHPLNFANASRRGLRASPFPGVTSTRGIVRAAAALRSFVRAVFSSQYPV